MLEPTRAEVDAIPGPVLLEFGASWCPHCQAIQGELAELLRQYPEVAHIKVEDGRGQPLGRSFRVKLWPNLVFMRDGQVRRQLARPPMAAVRAAMTDLVGSADVTSSD